MTLCYDVLIVTETTTASVCFEKLDSLETEVASQTKRIT